MAVQQPQVPPQQPPQAQQPQQRGAGIAWAVAALALIILASTGSAFLAYLMFNRSVPARAPEATQAPAQVVERRAASAEAAAPAPLGPTLDAGEFIVNLAPGPGLGIRYARLGVVIEVDRREVIDELQRRQPQVQDAIIGVVRSKRFEDLSSREGAEALRKELVEVLQRLVSKGKVVNVYYTQLVIQ
ncbi:MAG: flagellar basal body-associated FliL family protein [Bacillota bacterium]